MLNNLLDRFSAYAAAIGTPGVVFGRFVRFLEFGIDGQISNWVVDNFDAESARLGTNISFLYIDTSTPFMRVQGVEQMDPELFLRSAPRFLAWILRLFFVDEVVGR